jgi:catechol 2,3-dioxygenase-like lactoylglutathione lyase family enzyme
MTYTLSAVRLFVADFERAKQFYSETIGMPVAMSDHANGYFILDTGVVKTIVEVETDAEDGVTDIGGFKPYSFAVPDIQRTYAELTAKGVPFRGQPEKAFWGGTLAYFTDPDGNELTLVEY